MVLYLMVAPLLCSHIELIGNFDLLKAYGYIERVVKFDFFSEKTYFTNLAACSWLPSYISTMLGPECS